MFPGGGGGNMDVPRGGVGTWGWLIGKVENFDWKKFSRLDFFFREIWWKGFEAGGKFKNFLKCSIFVTNSLFWRGILGVSKFC